MNESAKPCIHSCGRQTTSESGECPICRSGLYYWKKKRASDRLRRRNQLDVLSSRLDTHFDMRGRRNEEPLVQPQPQATRSKVTMLRERRK